jgi:hypothetical protein
MPGKPNAGPVRHLLAAVVLLSGCFISDAAGQEKSETRPELRLADLIEQTEPSCVRLDVICSDGEGIGSGFVVQQSDWIVTNYHVVAGATKATATFADGTKAEVEGFLAYGEKRDVAVLKLKLDKRRPQPLKLATVLPRKGESVVAIGAPQGLSFTASEGIISAVRDGKELAEFGADALGTWLQTSTPISPGSSGGPLLNRQGEVVGANSASLASAQNLNFAVSAQDIADILKVAARSELRDLARIDPPPSRPQSRPRSSSGTPQGETVVCHLPAQRRFNHRYRIAKEEDEFDKVTWLRTEWIPLNYSDPRLATCGLRVGVPYREDSPAPGVIWEVGATAKTFAFIAPGAKRFQLLIDDESVELSEPEHKGEVARGGVAETLTTAFTIQGFLEVIMAKEVKARVGALEYRLGPAQLECLRDLASRLPTGETAEGQVRVERYDLEDDPSVPPSLAKKPRAAASKTSSSTESKPAKQTTTSEFRTWTSTDGKFTIEAKLLSVTGDSVELQRKDNGMKIQVPRAKLSAADQEYLSQRS